MTTIEPGELSDLNAVVEAWVDLAADQRRHGSYVVPESNRDAIRGLVGSHVIDGGLLVARAGGSGAEPVGDEPVGDEPVGDEPVGDEPVGDEPVGDEPVGDESAGDEPVGDEPTDDLVGFVVFGSEDGGLELDATRGVIRHLWVRADRRGEGIGSALLDAAERHLVERGTERVTLDVLAENEAARRFYRERGFRTHRLELEKELDGEFDSGDTE